MIIFAAQYGKQNAQKTNPILMKRILTTIAILAATAVMAVAQTLPPAEEVLEVAERVNAWFMQSHDPVATFMGGGKVRTTNLWTRAVYHEGLMALYGISPKDEYLKYNKDMADGNHWEPRYGVTTRDADNYCCVQTYVDLYRIDPEHSDLAPSRQCLELIMADGKNSDWWWIDAIQMGMPAFAKMGKTLGDKRYWQKMHRMYVCTRDSIDGGLWNAEDGLWWRDHDFNPPYQTPNGRQCYWSRGNGWVVAALVRVLDELPENEPYYELYRQDLLAMCRALKPLQRADGLWNCDLGDPDNYGGPEASGTSLFIYGMAYCVRRGWLSADEFVPVISRAWNGLVSLCVHPDGFLGYIQGTGKEPKDSQPTTYDKAPDFEDFGIGCFLLGATEVYRLRIMDEGLRIMDEGLGIKDEGLAIMDWAPIGQEAKPGTRWWWMGSAVDSAGLTHNMTEYAKAGIGAVEITPIYGVMGNEGNDIDFLSDRWMKMLEHTLKEGERLGIEVDMNTGTGWPFGGPEVTEADAAQRITSIDTDKGEITYAPTHQQVKRAAPGGEGLVIDHLNAEAVKRYLGKFTEAFRRTGTKVPHTFFNDSYEVYGADWTPAMLCEFEARRGYRLQDHLSAFANDTDPEHKDVICDYRETMSDILLEAFTHQWTDWAHSLGAKVRNQAHGSPANLLDVYAAVDIPEIEGYGLSDFGINGLRTDSLWKKNDSDLSMLKYASSAAHVTGKPLTSSETFTWLGEHFRTSLSQCKPDFDLMQVGGVNHCYFHGTTYSPPEAEWPGHLFYASMEMSPVNPIWHDAPAFFKYITRVQAFMQYGQPDNDLLVYLPIYDMWYDNPDRLLMFAIHGMELKAPRFVSAVNQMYEAGYDMDYISDRQIENTTAANGTLTTEGGTRYKAIVIPEVRHMQPQTLRHLLRLAQKGATVMFVGDCPTEAPGLADKEARNNEVAAIMDEMRRMKTPNIIFAPTYDESLKRGVALRPETMKSEFGLKAIRRSNPLGHHYFISALQARDVDGFVTLATKAEAAILFDPMNGTRSRAEMRHEDGQDKVRLQLASGQSCILLTISDTTHVNNLKDIAAHCYYNNYASTDSGNDGSIDLTENGWTIDARGLDSKTMIRTQSIRPWTDFDELSTTMGTATYTTQLKLSARQLRKADNWMLDLGDVRESARVRVNGHDAGTLFAVPFRMNIGQWLKPGRNTIEIEVTGLAANHIAQMDRDGKVWRKFKNANIAPLPGTTRTSDFSGWGTIPGGINGQVRLVPMRETNRQPISKEI